jgi:3-oxosteroid 1-dehydrogenase
MAMPTECDVLVVGSGAGGLLTAVRAHDLGLGALVIEKADRYGGTSAVSGGGIWIPNNDAVKAVDSPELALTYLRHCTEGQVADDKLQAYIDNAPRLVKYLIETLGLEYFSVPGYPDYNLEYPGALVGGGRSMLQMPFDGKLLGEELFNLREPHPYYRVFRRIHFDLAEMAAVIQRLPGWWRTAGKMVLRYVFDWPWRFRTLRDRRLTLGNALIGGLRKAMLDRKIPLILSTPLVRLIGADGRVTGAVVHHRGNELTIHARKAVVLASGGFEKNQELRNRYIPTRTSIDWSITPGSANAGDALLAAQAVGADTEFMDQAWWVPSIRVPAPVFTNVDMRVGLFSDRALPGTVCVNRLGRRFINEAISYHDFGKAMLAEERKSGAAIPCWMIFDATVRWNYPIGGLMPSFIKSDRGLPPNFIDNVLYRSDTVRELAAKIDVDPDALAETVAQMNEYASTGVDVQFGRGASPYDRWFGDPRSKPNPNLGPISRKPFYAVRVDLGDIGTKGGPKVDRNANVLNRQGEPIRGLYAVGNVSGSVTAASYPGAGGTLGPSMTFGYVAAEHIASAQTDSSMVRPLEKRLA